MTTTTDAILTAILAELRGLRADMRRDRRMAALRSAIEEEFYDGAFTVRGLFEVARLDPDASLTRALASLVDMAAPERSRTTALGRLLAGVPWLVAEGESRGSALYRLADLPDQGPQDARGTSLR